MSEPALKIANYDVDPNTGEATRRAPAPTGRWIPIAVAAERAGFTNPSAVRGLIYRRSWKEEGLAQQNAAGEWLVDEGADPRFAAPGSKSVLDRAGEFDWNAIPEKQRQVALFRLNLIRDCEQYIRSASRGRRTPDVIDEFLKLRHVRMSVRSYQRYAKKFQCKGIPEGLLDDRLDGTPKETGYAEFYELFKAAFLEYGNARPTAVYRLVCGKVRTQKLGIDIPTERQIRRYAATIPAGEKIYHRVGPKAFDDRCAAYIERDWTQIKVEERGEVIVRPMETNDIWCADHHPCDVIVQKDGKLLRPWLSAWMDMRSRRIVGRVITFRDPNSTTVLQALRDGIMRNGLLVPAWAFTDNGKDYDAWMWDGRTKKQRRKRIVHDQDHFGGVYQQLEIGHLHARPYNAKAKPIERFFRTFEEQFNVFEKTYCGRSTDTKPERLADNLDRGLAPEFEDYAIRALAWIDDVYANQESDAQPLGGKTPNAVYTANLLTRRVTTLENLDCCLLLSKQLKVGRNGITWQHRTYGKADPALRHLFGKEVLLRIDPNDVTQAQVWDATGKHRYCIVQRNDLRVVSTVSDDQERDAIRAQASHNRQLKNVQKRGMRRVESPGEILLQDALQKARERAKDQPPPVPPEATLKMLQTGIDASSIDDQPLRKAVGAESASRRINSTLAAFAEDDA